MTFIYSLYVVNERTKEVQEKTATSTTLLLPRSRDVCRLSIITIIRSEHDASERVSGLSRFGTFYDTFSSIRLVPSISFQADRVICSRPSKKMNEKKEIIKRNLYSLLTLILVRSSFDRKNKNSTRWHYQSSDDTETKKHPKRDSKVLHASNHFSSIITNENSIQTFQINFSFASFERISERSWMKKSFLLIDHRPERLSKQSNGVRAQRNSQSGQWSVHKYIVYTLYTVQT